MKPDASGLLGLHVLADLAPGWKWSPVAQALAACMGGASVVQLRAKEATDAQILELAGQMRDVTRTHGLLFIVNDRFDLALAAGADGVHLGQDDLAPARLPEDARARLLIGRSTHTPDQLRAARDEPVDYVAYGPVFGTTSKQSDWSARGTEGLARASALAAPRPLVAIGGIAVDNVAAVAAAGARGFAVISAVANAEDPERVVRELVRTFSRGGAVS